MPRSRQVPLLPDQRRQLLLDAATWVFARKGYRAASVSDIIQRAKVARGTFYLYFPSKQAVFLAIVEAFHTQIRQALTDSSASVEAAADPQQMLRHGFTRWISLFADHRDAAVVILREASSIDPRFERGYADLRRTVVRHFVERYGALQARGAIRASVSAELLARLLVGMFDELLNAYVLAGDSTDVAELAGALADFVWNGIRPR